MSNPEVAPNPTELLDSSKPYRLDTGYLRSQASSSNPWEFSVGELYGCVCHRAFDELAQSPIESNARTGLPLPERGVKKAGWDQRSASETSSVGITLI